MILAKYRDGIDKKSPLYCRETTEDIKFTESHIAEISHDLRHGGYESVSFDGTELEWLKAVYPQFCPAINSRVVYLFGDMANTVLANCRIVVKKEK